MAKIQTFAALLKKADMTFEKVTKVATTKSGANIFDVVLKNGETAQYTVVRSGNKLSQSVSQFCGKHINMTTENLDDVAALASTKDGKSIFIPGKKISSYIIDHGKSCSPCIHASIQKTCPAVETNIAGGKVIQKIKYGVETHADDLMGDLIMPTDSYIAANGVWNKTFQRAPRLDSRFTGASLIDLNKIYG